MHTYKNQGIIIKKWNLELNQNEPGGKEFDERDEYNADSERVEVDHGSWRVVKIVIKFLTTFMHFKYYIVANCDVPRIFHAEILVAYLPIFAKCTCK